MPLPMFNGKVNYKNSQLVTAVDGGLNESSDPATIDDSCASEFVNATIVGDSTIQQMASVGASSVMETYTSARACAFFVDKYGYNHVITRTNAGKADRWKFDIINTDLSAHNVSISDDAHVVGFSTAAGYFILVGSYASPDFLVMDYSTFAITKHTAPGDVFCMEVFSNRLFISTLPNTIWWTKAGTYGSSLTDWYGGVSTENYVAEDSGFWILENDARITHLKAFSGTLLAFTTSNIYSLSGYSPETFSLVKINNGVGISSGKGHPTTSQERMWFVYGENLYEMTYGFDIRIINKPVIANGSIVNGIRGGLAPAVLASVYTHGHVCADSEYLYLYNHHSTTTYPDNNVYRYDIFRSAWNVVSKLTNPYDTGVSISVFAAQHDSLTAHRAVRWCLSDGDLSEATPTTKTYSALLCDGSFTVTSKAFTNGSATQSALSNIWLQYKLSDIATATDITVSMSRLTTGDTDWTIVWHGENILGTGDIQTQRIMIPMNMMMTSEFYRIKIECSGALMTLYPYTREVRTKARG